MVIRQYRASGPLSKTILPVVALDDVFGIVAFGIAMSVAKLTMGGTGQSGLSMFVQPFMEIIGSLALGAVFGFILLFLSKRAQTEEETQIFVITAIALVGLVIFALAAIGDFSTANLTDIAPTDAAGAGRFALESVQPAFHELDGLGVAERHAQRALDRDAGGHGRPAGLPAPDACRTPGSPPAPHLSPADASGTRSRTPAWARARTSTCALRQAHCVARGDVQPVAGRHPPDAGAGEGRRGGHG